MFDEPLVFSKDDGCCKTITRWFSSLAPEIPSTPFSSSLGKGKTRNKMCAPPIKSSLFPFFVMELLTRTFFTGVGSCIYVFHNFINKILMLGIIGDSKLAHSKNHPKTSPHIIILDGKLYVIGGLKYTSPANYCFMEFFDPNIGTWEPLPNPPFHRQPSEIVTTLFENRKKKREYIVTSYSTRFYTYNVNDCTQPNLNPAVPEKLFKGYYCHPIWLNLLILVTCCI